jgi:hypothetical protein
VSTQGAWKSYSLLAIPRNQKNKLKASRISLDILTHKLTRACVYMPVFHAFCLELKYLPLHAHNDPMPSASTGASSTPWKEAPCVSWNTTGTSCMLLPSNDGCDGDKKFSLLNKWNFNETNASIDARTVHHFSGENSAFFLYHWFYLISPWIRRSCCPSSSTCVLLRGYYLVSPCITPIAMFANEIGCVLWP